VVRFLLLILPTGTTPPPAVLRAGHAAERIRRADLAGVLAVLRGVHGQQIVDDEVSLSYVANEVATTYTG